MTCVQNKAQRKSNARSRARKFDWRYNMQC
jgi:hypothetical protein